MFIFFQTVSDKITVLYAPALFKYQSSELPFYKETENDWYFLLEAV